MQTQPFAQNVFVMVSLFAQIVEVVLYIIHFIHSTQLKVEPQGMDSAHKLLLKDFVV